MSAWWEGRMLALDTETTGTNTETARIVTAAIALVGGGEPTETRTWLVDPGVEIPKGASDVHGITTERARAEGRPADEVIAEVLTEVGAAVVSGLPLVIFNASFDLTILDREARRYCDDGVPDWSGVGVIDPFVIDRHLDKYRKGSRKLEAMCEHYGATLDGAHDAAFDALAAARVAYRIGQRGAVVRKAWNDAMLGERAELEAEWETVRHDLARLHAAQVRWAAEQATGLAEHFRRQGKLENAAGVRPEWPLDAVRGAKGGGVRRRP
jgi:DNA polymerase III epsilon subunit-like protein